MSVAAVIEATHVEIKSHYCKIPNQILDNRKLPLSSSQRYVYLALVRHAHGYHRDHCKVSLDYLREYTGLSAGTIRANLKHLSNKGLIEQIGPWDFRVNLPLETPLKLVEKQPLETPEINNFCDSVSQNLLNQAQTEAPVSIKPDAINTKSTKDKKERQNSSPLPSPDPESKIELREKDLSWSLLAGVSSAAWLMMIRILGQIQTLRSILSIIFLYVEKVGKKPVQILNPSALLIFWTRKNQSQNLDDNTIKDHWRSSLYRLYSQLRGDSSSQQELIDEVVRYDWWLRDQDGLPLEQLYLSYYQRCPLLSEMYTFFSLASLPPATKYFFFPLPPGGTPTNVQPGANQKNN